MNFIRNNFDIVMLTLVFYIVGPLLLLVSLPLNTNNLFDLTLIRGHLVSNLEMFICGIILTLAGIVRALRKRIKD